jgi:hypothetical protein
LPTMHRNHSSELEIHPGSAFSASALRSGAHVLTYAPLRCSPSHADYPTMPNF